MTMLRNIGAIARRDYLARVRSRSFVLLTVLLAVVAFGLGLLPVAIRAVGGEERTAIAVVSEDPRLPATELAAAFEAQLNASPTRDAPTADGDRFELEPAADAERAMQAVRDGGLAVVLTASRTEDNELRFEVYSREVGFDRTLTLIRAAAASVTFQDRLTRAGIDPGEQARLFAPPEFVLTPVDPSPEAAQPAEVAAARYLLATVLVVILFLAIITYGQWVATSVVEEKSSRVMELLISAASPNELLAGKVLGSGAAGITQYVAILVPALISFTIQQRIGDALMGQSSTSIDEFGLSLPLLLLFGLFFVLGFLLYALLYAAAGSLVSRQEEVQQISGPMILLATVGYFISLTAVGDLDSEWVRVVSLVPFFSPYLMVTRAVMGQVTPAELVLAVVLLLATILLATWLAARIYSAGVLMYGQRPGLRAFLRAARVRH